ncbi:cell division protein DamX [Cronobacter muytjensii]
MDEFKPEDELKPDPSDRRPGRSRKPAEFDNEPQINIDDVDVDAEDRRSARTRRAQTEETYEADESLVDDEVQERRPRKRKKAPPKGPISRQHLMMALGILVLVLLIIGIGSALKGPDATKADDAQAQNAEKNIDLSGNAGSPSDQANGAQPQPGDTSAANQTTGNSPQDISLPPVSSTPTQAQTPAAPEGQQRVEVPGDLNNALTQQQGQIDNAVSGSTLPTEPATVAPVNGNGAASQQPPRDAAQAQTPARHNANTTRPERKQMVIESEPRKAQTTQSKPQQAPAKTTATEQKPASATKRSEPATGTASAPVKAPASTAATAPKSSAPAASQSSAPAGGASAGNVGALKSAPGSHYTLQLSSSSNYNNLNAWAKKENLKNYVVYQTTRNGQPWYVLVSGVYGSKDEAKRAVSSLPADVQAKNPWAKPIHQVQADLK